MYTHGMTNDTRLREARSIDCMDNGDFPAQTKDHSMSSREVVRTSLCGQHHRELRTSFSMNCCIFLLGDRNSEHCGHDCVKLNCHWSSRAISPLHVPCLPVGPAGSEIIDLVLPSCLSCCVSDSTLRYLDRNWLGVGERARVLFGLLKSISHCTTTSILYQDLVGGTGQRPFDVADAETLVDLHRHAQHPLRRTNCSLTFMAELKSCKRARLEKRT